MQTPPQRVLAASVGKHVVFVALYEVVEQGFCSPHSVRDDRGVRSRNVRTDPLFKRSTLRVLQVNRLTWPENCAFMRGLCKGAPFRRVCR